MQQIPFFSFFENKKLVNITYRFIGSIVLKSVIPVFDKRIGHVVFTRRTDNFRNNFPFLFKPRFIEFQEFFLCIHHFSIRKYHRNAAIYCIIQSGQIFLFNTRKKWPNVLLKSESFITGFWALQNQAENTNSDMKRVFSSRLYLVFKQLWLYYITQKNT